MVTALIVLGVALILGIIIACFWWYVKFYFCSLLYFICIAIFEIMDFFQDLFLIFAGLPPTGASGATNTQDGDMLQWFMTQSSVRNAFLGLLALAGVLLVIFTVIQIIRVEYTTEGAQNAKGNVLKNAFKALTMFAIVPAFCAMGVIAGNALLKAINTATGGDTRVTLSGKLFLLGANDGDPKLQKEKDDEYYKFVPGVPLITFLIESVKSGDGKPLDAFYEELAYGEYNLMENPSDFDIQEDSFVEDNLHKDFDTVVRQYDITKIGWGYIIMFLLGPLFISALYSAMVGMIMRIYMAIILYVISPPIVAMYVLDEGSAYKNWRQRFIGTVLSGYGTVVAFNLYMMIAEVVSGSEILKFFGSDFLNRAVELIFLLVGAMMLKNISKTISGIIGADDAMEQGEGIGKQITDKAKKVGKTAVGVGVGAATLAVGGAAMIGAKGAGIAAKVAAKAGKGEAKFRGMFSQGKANKVNKRQAEFDKKRDEKAQKKFNKDYSELSTEEKEKIDKKMSHSFAGSRLESAQEGLSKNQANISKALNRGRGLHVAAARAGQLGKSNIVGMFANSSVGKSFNQITGNSIKATGGKGIDQWDGEISSKSDLEKDIFQEYNKAQQQIKEEKYNKKLGSVGDNFVRENANAQVKEMAQTEYKNIVTAGKESGAKEQQTRLDMQQIVDAIKRAIETGGAASSTQMEKMYEIARQHAELTGNTSMLDHADQLSSINNAVINGDISTSQASDAIAYEESEMHLDQKVETKVEAEIKNNGDNIEKLKTAVMAGNQKAMKEALASLQEKLASQGIEVKNIDQITKEIQELATTEKANEKKLTKLMSQIGKLTGK